MENSYTISFNSRTIEQIYTAYTNLREKYNQGVACVKRLINGFWSGYFVITKQERGRTYTCKTEMDAFLAWNRKANNRRIGKIIMANRSLSDNYVKGVLHHWLHIPKNSIPYSLVDIQRRKIALIRNTKIKNNG